MSYETVFEITQKAYEWWWPSIGLIFLVIGVILIKFGPILDRNKNKKKIGLTFAFNPRRLGWMFVIFASFWTLLAFGSTYISHREYVEAYRTGKYLVVEGVVKDFHPMPYEGHQNECFRVDKEKFCYSDYDVSAAFNQSASHGGPIRAGLPVRIAYFEDSDFQAHILRLEIRSDSLPSAAERATYAKTQEEKWHRDVKDYPTQDSLLLGFSFASFLICLCWNLDWKHYVRYWIRNGPPHTRFVELGFRTFFLACLVGASIQLVRMFLEKPRTVADFEKAALYSLPWLGFFGLFDLIVRWRLRVRNQSVDGQEQSPSS
jgi:hypothetical protein